MPRFLTVAEVAERLSVSVQTVRRLVHAGQLPAVRVGQQIRVPETNLNRLPKVGEP